jgi:TonB family protein
MSRITSFALGLLMALPLAAAGQPPAQDPRDKPPNTRPNPDASGIYHVGQGVTPPRAVHTVDPRFSDKARRKKVQGVCVVSLVVDPAGKPQKIHILRSLADRQPANLRSAALELDRNAMRAVSQYRFAPAIFQGKPVPVEIAVEVNFQLY